MKATNILQQVRAYTAEDTCMYGVPHEAAVTGGREHKGKQVARLVSLNCISSLRCPRQIAGLDRPQYDISYVFEDLHYTL